MEEDGEGGVRWLVHILSAQSEKDRDECWHSVLFLPFSSVYAMVPPTFMVSLPSSVNPL